jgi:hypothetical protein
MFFSLTQGKGQIRPRHIEPSFLWRLQIPTVLMLFDLLQKAQTKGNKFITSQHILGEFVLGSEMLRCKDCRIRDRTL